MLPGSMIMFIDDQPCMTQSLKAIAKEVKFCTRIPQQVYVVGFGYLKKYPTYESCHVNLML